MNYSIRIKSGKDAGLLIGAIKPKSKPYEAPYIFRNQEDAVAFAKASSQTDYDLVGIRIKHTLLAPVDPKAVADWLLPFSRANALTRIKEYDHVSAHDIASHFLNALFDNCPEVKPKKRIKWFKKYIYEYGYLNAIQKAKKKSKKVIILDSKSATSFHIRLVWQTLPTSFPFKKRNKNND